MAEKVRITFVKAVKLDKASERTKLKCLSLGEIPQFYLLALYNSDILRKMS